MSISSSIRCGSALLLLAGSISMVSVEAAAVKQPAFVHGHGVQQGLGLAGGLRPRASEFSCQRGASRRIVGPLAALMDRPGDRSSDPVTFQAQNAIQAQNGMFDKSRTYSYLMQIQLDMQKQQEMLDQEADKRHQAKKDKELRKAERMDNLKQLVRSNAERATRKPVALVGLMAAFFHPMFAVMVAMINKGVQALARSQGKQLLNIWGVVTNVFTGVVSTMVSVTAAAKL